MNAKIMVQGIIGAYLMEGVQVIKIDHEKHVLYISLPERSESYGKSESIQTAEDFAKRIKKCWIEMGIFPEECSVKYKTRDEYWTKEMGDKNYHDNIDKVLNLIL